ncbi:MAG: nucleotide exchange factor GrpE, partial [Clostridia bacterium]|nr:nucleotide exchange factor GrpE [Clostridia bacterium]
ENEQLIADVDRLTEENQKLSKTVARLQSSADNSDKYRDQLVALKSDFDSYKRRMKNDAETCTAKARVEVVEKILPILDNFDLAKAHLDADNLKAFEMVQNQFLDILSNLGVIILNPKGEDFDATTMNALSTMDYGEENSGKVVEVYKKGYVYGTKVIRYAEVIVGK